MNSHTSGSPETAPAHAGAESGPSDSPGEPEPGTRATIETKLANARALLQTTATGRSCEQIR